MSVEMDCELSAQDLPDGQPERPQVQFCDLKSNSILIKNEYIYDVLELSKNKFLVATLNDLLLVQDWEVVSRVKESEKLRHMSLQAVPFFHADSFPYALSSGNGGKNINLINIKTGIAQDLVLS